VMMQITTSFFQLPAGERWVLRARHGVKGKRITEVLTVKEIEQSKPAK
jgi:hypothetical protein